MIISPNIANVMHLFHEPDANDIEENLSYCHICLLKTSLTKEHIPPKKAYNNYSVKLWEELHYNNKKSIKKIRGGLTVKTICKRCNNEVCSPYANEYISFAKNLVESPKLFHPFEEASIVSLYLNTLMVAKEIATMILAVEQISFSKQHPSLRDFVMNKDLTIEPPFKIFGFLVPKDEEAGTVSRYTGRVDTYAPGYGFRGGEISWYPFGFVYADKIGSAYQPEKLTDITHWFKEKKQCGKSTTFLKLYCRVTGVDSIGCTLGNKRRHPQKFI